MDPVVKTIFGPHKLGSDQAACFWSTEQTVRYVRYYWLMLAESHPCRRNTRGGVRIRAREKPKWSASSLPAGWPLL